MQLIDFSALLQLLATFFVAFIAIEYAKSYTSVLANNLFDFAGKVRAFETSNKMNESIELGCFKEERFHLGKPLKFLESTKDNMLSLNNGIEEVCDGLLKFIEIKCNFEHFRNISLHMFVYCLELLFLAGLDNDNAVFRYTITHLFCSSFFVLLCFLMGMMGCRTDTKYRTSNNRITFGYLLITILLSVLVSNGLMLKQLNLTSTLWDWTVIAVSVFPVIVFLLGVLYVWINGLYINREINKRFKPVKEKRDAILKDIEDWKTHDRMEEKYDVVEGTEADHQVEAAKNEE